MDKHIDFTKIEKKLADIGFEIDGNEHLEIELDELEGRNDIQIPEEYRKFILKYGGLSFEEDMCFRPIEKSRWTQENSMQGFDYFYGLDGDNLDIRKKRNIYLDRMPNSIIPIAECPGGNQLCLGVELNNYGKIYFWDHENELEAKKMLGFNKLTEINSYWDNVFLVSESFSNFIMDLEIVESSESDDDDDLEEIWLSDDLLRNKD
ncbi:SMI1/KNR4 family protein [Clostridium estertheticum]|uniref:SMI1/KNR4 family protein n=1 Tax=Clostridium estertheticum TaxID=238834 RepID=A0A5N7IMV7_9CLOT|nr:SMI1/KNR4 family protein [Clostridium estertheticum]MPQ31648.1 SMI1/KNR4 family protein [Clostridium estertheticum]MPQ62312.1 SMI1/KNR4 family protein [Clostridium estertheticum]